MKSGPKTSAPSRKKRRAQDSIASISSRILYAQDEERRRISRDLHDTVGQSLAAVKMNLQTLTRCRSTDNGRLEALQECIEIVDRSIEEVRTVSYLLHPPTLDLAGLASAIEWYSAGFSKRSGIEVATQLPAQMPRLPITAETALFRVVQECLTNVHRHSGASRARILIRVTETEVQLEVADNGHGIRRKQLRRATDYDADVGVGIPGMRERLRELGGNLEIQTGDWGTKLAAVVPRRMEQPLAEMPLAPGAAARPAREATDKVKASNRILIVDDHEIIRRGVRELFAMETDLEICGEASSANEAVEKTLALAPDLIILDLQMPGRNGWSVVAELRNVRHAAKFLIFTAYEYEGLSRVVRRARCEGFVTKSRASADLIRAARAILKGGTFFTDNSALAARA